MLRFPSRSRQTVLAGLALLAGPAAAQAPAAAPVPAPAPVAPAAPAPVAPAAPAPVPVTPAPPVAPPTPVIDPQVTALFNEAIAAHTALSALTATLSVQTAGTGQDTTQTVTLAYQKPGQAKVTVADKTGPLVQILANGKKLTIFAAHENEYRIQDIPPGADGIPTVLSQSRTLLARILSQPAMLSELLTQPGVTATLGTSDTVGGVATDTVNAALTTPDGGKIQFVFDFGKDDHLVRRLAQTATLTQVGKAQTFTHTETVTALSAAPTLTASDFVFTPPPGAKKAPTSPTAKATPPKEPPMHDPRLVPGAKPFALAAKDITGKPLSLAQYTGKVVLMDFWATWCGPCVGEMPNVIAAYKKYHTQGFEIVGISLDEDKAALTAFTAKNKMPWRQVFDGKGWQSAVPRQYGVNAIPFGLLIGRDGKIVAVDVRGDALPMAIQKALAQKPAAKITLVKKTASVK